MKRIVQINTVVNSGSTGLITEKIAQGLQTLGWESWIAYGRGNPRSSSELIKVGNRVDMALHGMSTRLFDNHGLISKKATKELISKIEHIDPTIIQLHNIHGYYLNYEYLFHFLREFSRPVVWTLHDCWAFTGHCSHYTVAGCDKWKSHCGNCIQKKSYPKSLLLDNSKLNYQKKKDAFSGLSNLHIITVSEWLMSQVKMSFLRDTECTVIHNGVNTDIFRPSPSSKPNDKTLILGVAGQWSESKGLGDFIKLRQILPQKYEIILVGLSKKQIEKLPDGITGIERTESREALARLYASADVYVNTSLEETLGMTTIEAMSCGTPAIVYNSTACAEPIEPTSCIAVNPGKVSEIALSIGKITTNVQSESSIKRLRDWVTEYYSDTGMVNNYIKLYNNLLGAS